MTGTLSVIEIISTEKTDGAESQPSVFCARGVRGDVNGNTHILYEEKDAEGLVTKTHMILRERNFEIRRTGGVEAVFLYERGTVTDAVYRTSYGEIPIGIRTRDCTSKEEDGALHIAISYELLQGTNILSERRVEITVREDAC